MCSITGTKIKLHIFAARNIFFLLSVRINVLSVVIPSLSIFYFLFESLWWVTKFLTFGQVDGLGELRGEVTRVNGVVERVTDGNVVFVICLIKHVCVVDSLLQVL